MSILTPNRLQTLAQDVEPKNWEITVLQSFVTDNRITSIPAGRKKRFVLLKWLVEKFECDRDYSEKEINTVLKPHHEDCATLRREFIGYRLMSRDRDVYRRLPETEWLSEVGNFN